MMSPSDGREAASEGVALALAVLKQDPDGWAQLTRDLDRVVGRVPVDDDDLEQLLERQPREHVRQVGCLVERRDDDAHPRMRARWPS